MSDDIVERAWLRGWDAHLRAQQSEIDRRCGVSEFMTERGMWEEIARLRAELTELRASRRWEYIEALEYRADKSEAALARVRAHVDHGLWTSWHDRAKVVRALDGAE